ncbi:MAG TPA: Fe-S-containing protein [Candidatus Binataceae bacterium]|nr:Fe-S-containing protein [Candidatus Binataceae bacterium]
MRVSILKVLGMLAILLIAGTLLMSRISRPACTSLRGTDTLTVKLADLAPGKIRAFCYKDEAGRKLRFLLARDSGGQVHAVFDACRQCYKFHKGYDYSHGYLICRVCGNRYPIGAVSTGEGSCVPVPLSHQTSHGQVTIKVADVKAGKWWF